MVAVRDRLLGVCLTAREILLAHGVDTVRGDYVVVQLVNFLDKILTDHKAPLFRHIPLIHNIERYKILEFLGVRKDVERRLFTVSGVYVTHSMPPVTRLHEVAGF